MGWKPLTITKCFHALCIFTSMTAHNTYTIVSVSCSIPNPYNLPILVGEYPYFVAKDAASTHDRDIHQQVWEKWGYSPISTLFLGEILIFLRFDLVFSKTTWP